jgi:hypothetical protein
LREESRDKEKDGGLGDWPLVVQLSGKEMLVLKTQKNKVSSGIGVHVDGPVKGLRDALPGEKLLMTEDDLRSAKNLAFRLPEAWRNARTARADITAALPKRFQIGFDSS